MQLGRVIGTATSTVRHPTLAGWKLLVVQCLQNDGRTPDGEPLVAIDPLGAGRGDMVVISSDGRGIAVVLWYPPAGGKWCDACALAVVANAGVHAGGVIEIPRDRTTFTGRTNAGVIQIYPPANQGTEGVIELTYSPPGASCLPNPILLIPIHLNEPKKE